MEGAGDGFPVPVVHGTSPVQRGSYVTEKYLSFFAPNGFPVLTKGKAVFFIQALFVTGQVDTSMALNPGLRAGVVDDGFAVAVASVGGECIDETNPGKQGIVQNLILTGQRTEGHQMFSICQEKQLGLQRFGLKQMV